MNLNVRVLKEKNRYFLSRIAEGLKQDCALALVGYCGHNIS